MFLNMRVFVGRESINIVGGDISIGVGSKLNTKAHKSQSWVIKLKRILLVLYSETCQCLASSLR